MIPKATVGKAAVIGLAVILTAGGAVMSKQFAAIRQFDADPSCVSASPVLPASNVPAEGCVRKPVRIAQTWSGSVGRSGRAYHVRFVDDSATERDAQIAPADSVFVQMLYPGEATDAVYYRGRVVRIAFRQYWLQTEDDPHRAAFKSEVILGVVLGMYLTIAATVYARMRAASS